MPELVVVAVVLMLADLATTFAGVRLRGPDIEGNPIHRWLIVRYGPWTFSLAYMVVWGLLIYLGAAHDYLLVGAIAALALVVANNLCVLARASRR